MAEIIVPQKTVQVSFSLGPAYNVLGSLSLLEMADDFSGLNEWVYRTARALSPEQGRTHQLVLHDAYAHLAGASWSSYGEWVDDLEAQDATAMRNHALELWLRRVSNRVGRELPAPSKLLADRAAYLSLAEESLGGAPFDRPFWEETYRLLNDPPARQRLMVTHLRAMWDQYLASEWERTRPMLEESIAAFQSLDFSGMTAAEVLGRVIMRAQIPAESTGWLESLDRLVLIPSAHTGPYLINFGGFGGTTAWLLFGARIPEGASVRPPALSRSELLMRLTALANDTRLRILELVAKKDELGTPDIVAQLGLSQSAAARHLEHLAATGFLTTWRHQGTNVFQLNPDRIDHTFKVLKEFCQ